MAKIALSFGAATAGFLLGGPLGAKIGFVLGGILGSVLFPTQNGSSRINDLVVSSATDGAAIPIVYNTQRVAGNVIWAPPLTEKSAGGGLFKGGPQTFVYSASFAVAFCEGPAAISRIWFDSKIVYDANPTSASITAISQIGTSVTVTSTLNPDVNTEVKIVGAPSGYNGNFVVTESTPTAFIVFNPHTGLSPGTGGTASFTLTSYPAPVIYRGDEDQQADPTIQAHEGASTTPAYRGLCYAVWSNFPLINFGNRIPNVRAEVTATIDPPITLPAMTFIDTHTQATGISPTASITGGPTVGGEVAIAIISADVTGPAGGPIVPDNTWTALDQNANGNHGSMFAKLLPSVVSPVTVSEAIEPTNVSGTITQEWTGFLIFAGGTNVLPTVAQRAVLASGALSTGSTSNTFGSNTTTGNMILVVVYGHYNVNFNPFTGGTPTDTQGNPYTFIGSATQAAPGPGFTVGAQCMVWAATNITGGPCTVSLNLTGSMVAISGSIVAYELSGLTFAQVPLTGTSAIVADICERAGLAQSQFDVTLLAGNSVPATTPPTAFPQPGGYFIARPQTAQNALKPLAVAFFFDAVESGGVIRFVPRGEPTATLTVPESDLGLEKDNSKLTEQIGLAQDLPREIQVLFNDKSLDYQQNKTQKRRHTRIVKTKQQTVLELPMTLDSTTARQIAEKSLFLAYLESKPFDMNLWKILYTLYDPTDVIQFVYEGLTFQMRIVKMGIGADFQIAISGVNENASNYLSAVVGSSASGAVIPNGNTLPSTVLFLYDIPLLRDLDANPNTGTGYYAAMSAVAPQNWPGGTIQQGSDNVNFNEDAEDSIAAHYGTASNILGAPPRSPWIWDMTNTLTVFMQPGNVLAGSTDLAVLNGANAIMVGNEVVQFVNAVQNMDGSFTISRLLRGRRGTEVNCGTHGASELVVDLTAGGFIRVNVALTRLNVLRYYRPVTFGADVSTVTSQLFTDTGQDLMPYAPCSLAGTRDMSLNLTLSWIRRTRIGGDWLENVGTVPLSEATESYDVEIMNGLTVVRTFSALSSPTVVYTAAEQVTDFGSTQSAVTFNVYQNSQIVGRGFKATATV